MSDIASGIMLGVILVFLALFNLANNQTLQEIISNQETIINLLNSTKIVIGQEIMK